MKDKAQGFSLIETVIYVVILSLMLIVVLEIVSSISKSERSIRSARYIESSALVGLERIEREVRGAQSVVTASSTLGTSPGDLVLSGTDDSGNPRTVELYLSGGELMYNENGVSQGSLTDPNANVTKLIFTRFATSTVEGIRTDIAIESGTSTFYRSEEFYASALLRKDESQ